MGHQYIKIGATDNDKVSFRGLWIFYPNRLVGNTVSHFFYITYTRTVDGSIICFVCLQVCLMEFKKRTKRRLKRKPPANNLNSRAKKKKSRLNLRGKEPRSKPKLPAKQSLKKNVKRKLLKSKPK